MEPEEERSWDYALRPLMFEEKKRRHRRRHDDDKCSELSHHLMRHSQAPASTSRCLAPVRSSRDHVGQISVVVYSFALHQHIHLPRRLCDKIPAILLHWQGDVAKSASRCYQCLINGSVPNVVYVECHPDLTSCQSWRTGLVTT